MEQSTKAQRLVLDNHSYLSLDKMLTGSDDDIELAMECMETMDFDESKLYIHALMRRTLGKQPSFAHMNEWEDKWKTHAPGLIQRMVQLGLWNGTKYTTVYGIAKGETPAETLEVIQKEFKELFETSKQK